MFRQMLGYLALTLLFGLGSMSAAQAERRVALLIGNSNYASAPRLSNPGNDVEAMAAMLRSAGFDQVMTGLDLDERGMRLALQNFEDAAANADIGLIFYSGHGIEMNGQNYLIPVDAKLASDRAIDDEAVPLERLLRSMEQVHRLRLVILDACRDNPFVPAMARTGAGRSVGRGLARIEPQSVDTLVAYAAKAGTVAADGEGRNSPFTSALLRHLATPGLDVRLALGLVRDDVVQATKSRQEPFVYGSLGGAVLPIAATAPPPPPPPAAVAPAVVSDAAGPARSSDGCGAAAAHWTEARAFDRVEFYEEHVRLFGSCAFAGFAQARIADLKKQQQAALSVPAAPAAPAAAAVAAAPAPRTEPVAPAAARTSPPANDCDRLAARPFDPNGLAPGVPLPQVDGAAATTACRLASQDFPDEPRFTFQLGRAAARLQRPDEAVRLYRIAADKGYAAAVTALAFSYAEGSGVARDPAQAETLYKRASDLGDSQAFHNLGWMYDRGDGVRKDPREAARLVVIAIQKGNSASLEQVTAHSEVWSPEFRKDVQTLMKERKIYAGPVDGRFTEQTKASLRTVAGSK